MNLTIRYAVPADTPILQTLGKSSYYHHFKELWDCPVELRQFINSEYAPDQLENSLNDPSVTWLIAESDKPVGFAKISWDRPVSGGNVKGESDVHVRRDFPFLARQISHWISSATRR